MNHINKYRVTYGSLDDIFVVHWEYHEKKNTL